MGFLRVAINLTLTLLLGMAVAFGVAWLAGLWHEPQSPDANGWFVSPSRLLFLMQQVSLASVWGYG